MLTLVGALLLLLSLAGVMLGVFMVSDRRTREPGLYFALWWTPAVAAAGGILMGDRATFIIGASCFVIAGAAFALERRGSRRRRTRGKRRGPRTAKKVRSSKEAKHGSSEKAEELSERARTRK